MKRVLILVAMCIGCGPKTASEMEAALTAANHGIALSLLSLEPVIWADAVDSDPSTTTTTTLRHGAVGDCPRIERTPDVGDDYQVLADYGSGCVSESGILPAILSGDALLEVTGDQLLVDVSGVTLDLDRLLVGAVRATLHPESADGTETLTVSSEFSLPEGNGAAVSVSAELEASLDTVGLVIDGSLDLTRDGESVTLQFDNVFLPEDKIAGECPRPTRGTIVVEGSPNITIDFAGGSADEAVLKRKATSSEPVRICSFPSDTW